MTIHRHLIDESSECHSVMYGKWDGPSIRCLKAVESLNIRSNWSPCRDQLLRKLSGFHMAMRQIFIYMIDGEFFSMDVPIHRNMKIWISMVRCLMIARSINIVFLLDCTHSANYKFSP